MLQPNRVCFQRKCATEHKEQRKKWSMDKMEAIKNRGCILVIRKLILLCTFCLWFEQQNMRLFILLVQTFSTKFSIFGYAKSDAQVQICQAALGVQAEHTGT